MRALVTGGRGFIGGRVVHALLEQGLEVRVLDNGSRGGATLSRDVELVDADIRDADRVRGACRAVDVCFHFAAVQGTRTFYDQPEVVLDVNLRGVLNVVDACAAEGVGRLLFASSSEVYGLPQVFPTPEDAPLVVPDPLNPRWSYGGSKIVGELVVVNWARRHAFDFTILRYHNVYGPAMGWDHVIPQFIERLELGHEFTVQGDGTEARAFCYVDDATEPTVVAALRPEGAGQIFNIGNPGAEHTIRELIETLSTISGRPIDPLYVPFEGGGTKRRLPDISRAEGLLGFAPTISLAQGLRPTYDWYAQQVAGREAAIQ